MSHDTADLPSLTVHAALDGLRAGDFTSVQLTQALLDRIDAVDGDVRAYLPRDRRAGAGAGCRRRSPPRCGR